tara:strand:+ start:931 stop:3180 length:2250 start_codon:yes stop_codon:yes gene_type:complete
MAKASSEKQFNNFTKGLVTEATALSFPDNASVDEDNFVLERTGRRLRRLGVDYEDNYVKKATGHSETVLAGTRQSIHRWNSPDGDTSKMIGIIRSFNKLWFINLLNASPTTEYLNSGNALTITGLANSDIQVTTINNNVVLVSADIDDPILLSYNTATEAVTQENLSVKIRDIWGVNDGLDFDERPTTLSDEHFYNLRNQGWSPKIISTCGSDAINCTFTTLAEYPSNADVWSFGKEADTSTSATYEKYNPEIMDRASQDNSPAGKGHYIIDALHRGASRVTESGIAVLPTDKENGNFSTVATYAGRVFYSGISSVITSGDEESPFYSGFIFFTQVATTPAALTRCYMSADPTSADISDIIDTDGGTIQLPDITKVVKLVSTKSSLLVFAENGVWEVFGDLGGFKATSFQASKVTSIGTESPRSIIEVNGSVAYWSRSGVFLLSQDSVSGRYQSESITLTTIQGFYNNISNIAIQNAIGMYEEQENRIRWLYNDDEDYATNNYINKYNKELILDLTLKSFYPNTISPLASASPYISDYIELPRFTADTTTEDVLVGTDVVLAATVGVTVTTSLRANRRTAYSFLVSAGTDITIGRYSNTSFLDWYTENSTGITYSSYLITGYDIFGDLMRKKYIPYLFMYFDRTEDGFTDVDGALMPDNPSSCMVQAQWDWADSINSGKWGTSFQTYRYKRNYIPTGTSDTFDYGKNIIVTKSKLRGNGKALSLRIESETGKDCKLLGWAVLMEAPARP